MNIDVAFNLVEKRKFTKAVQDYYPDHFANCFGCGRKNNQGLHTKTYWDSEKGTGICKPRPLAHHCGYKSVFHGGLISSIIECNSVAVSVAATYEAEDLVLGQDEVFYVLAIANTHFNKPVPVNADIVLETKLVKLYSKKAKCSVSVYADKTLCVTSDTVTIRVPNHVIYRKFNGSKG